MRVLVAQGVGDHERIEAVVLDCRDLVTLPGAGRDPRRHREHRVSYSLQMLDEQTFGSLDRDRQPVTEAAQPAIELGQAGDIVSYRCADCLDRWDLVLEADDLPDAP